MDGTNEGEVAPGDAGGGNTKAAPGKNPGAASVRQSLAKNG